ncbi:MAG: hypothetical protein JSR80_02430 [Verrucomicrobia bacterium]|nr:hypothetical protein [Verrucomicrobiota bacterium]
MIGECRPAQGDYFPQIAVAGAVLTAGAVGIAILIKKTRTTAHISFHPNFLTPQKMTFPVTLTHLKQDITGLATVAKIIDRYSQI